MNLTSYELTLLATKINFRLVATGESKEHYLHALADHIKNHNFDISFASAFEGLSLIEFANLLKDTSHDPLNDISKIFR